MARSRAEWHRDGALWRIHCGTTLVALLLCSCDPGNPMLLLPSGDGGTTGYNPLSAPLQSDASPGGGTPPTTLGSSDGTEPSLGATMPPADDCVTALTVSVNPAGWIDVAWTRTPSNDEGFLIQRYSDATGWIDLAQTTAATTSFQDGAIDGSVMYCYRVAAFNSAGTSAFCPHECAFDAAASTADPQATDTERPDGAPTRFAAVLLENNRIQLTWTDNATNEDGFLVQRQTSTTAWADYASVPSDSTSFVDTVDAAGLYCYRVRAFNTAGATVWTISNCKRVVTASSSSGTTPTDASIVEQMRALPPLPKVHYSWGLENGSLLTTADDPRLYEYVRLTHSACVTGEWASKDRVERVVRACDQVNATGPAIAATLGINYSPWHRVFPADTPPTYMGPEHDLEISTFRDKMLNVRNLIAAANTKYGSDVIVSVVLLNSEVWEIKQSGEPDAEAWNAALDVKYNAIYDVSKSVFPGAIVIWVAEGSGPYFTLREKTDGFFNTTAYNPARPEINYPFMRDLLAFCEQYGSSAAAMWISLASGWQAVPGAPTTYRYDWDYDLAHSWELGRRLNAPRLDGMAVPIQFICYWPAPFADISPAWGKHFAAYVRGAHGIPQP